MVWIGHVDVEGLNRLRAWLELELVGRVVGVTYYLLLLVSAAKLEVEGSVRESSVDHKLLICKARKLRRSLGMT